MTKELVIVARDDFDGSTGATTFLLSVQQEGEPRQEVEIELSAPHAEDLTNFLRPYFKAGRKPKSNPRPAAVPEDDDDEPRELSTWAEVQARRNELALVRQWAADNGIELDPRGTARVPFEVIDQYNAATNSQVAHTRRRQQLRKKGSQ